MIYFLFSQTPLKFLIQSFWRDEAFTYLLAKKNILEIILLTAKDFNPPFYYLTLHFWIKIVGASEIYLRLLSLIFFWCLLYVCFLFLNNVMKINVRKSFLYLILFLINPLLNYYAFEARMYTLFAFLATLSFYFLITNKKRGYAIATIIGLYTHYFMILVILSQIIFLLAQEKNKKQLRQKMMAILVSLFIFSLWIIFVLVQKPIVNESFWIAGPKLKTIFNLPAVIYSGYEYEGNFYQKSLAKLTLFISLFIIWGVVKMIINKDKRQVSNLIIFLLIWSLFSPLFIFFVSFYKPLFLSRYLIFSTVGLVFLIIFILESINSKIRIILLIFLFILTLNYSQLQIKYREKANIKKVILEIKKLAKKDDFLYVTDELNFHTAQYYFNESKVFIFGKAYEEIPVYVGRILIPREKIVITLPIYPKKAFILKDNLTYDIQATY